MELSDMESTFIKIPLYKLNFVSNINEIQLDENLLNQFCNEYEPEERKSIFKQLDWAVDNPEYNFNSLVTTDEFTDKEIYGYIQKLHKFLLNNKTI